MSNKKLHFNKTATSTKQQLNLLIQRGLIIENPQSATQTLSSIGLHRFSGYCRPFEKSNNPIRKFKNNTKFEQIWDLYVFDRKLRLLIIDAIERIEVAFRVTVSDVMSVTYDPFWYNNVDHFKSPNHYLDFMKKIIKLARAKENLVIRDYYNKYITPKYPPSWIIAECLTFGAWSKVFSNLKDRRLKNKIASRFNLPFIILESWMKCLTDMRNLCAHHERIWNRIFPHTPKRVTCSEFSKRKFYQQAIIINKLLCSVSPTSKWRERLFNLFEEHTNIPIIMMGFQNDWREDPFWEL